jgi:membrane protein DedA with SNARE-associated domain
MGAMLGPWGALAGGVIGGGMGIYDEYFSDEAKAKESERGRRGRIASMGDGIIFGLGSRYGTKLRTTKFFSLILPERRDAAVKAVFEKYGDKVIFMARFMPGLRTPLFFAAGSYHISVWKFLALDGLAAVISVPLWVYVGFLFGANLEELEKVVRKAQFGIYAGLVVLVLLFAGAYLVKKRYLRAE